MYNYNFAGENVYELKPIITEMVLVLTLQRYLITLTLSYVLPDYRITHVYNYNGVDD